MYYFSAGDLFPYIFLYAVLLLFAATPVRREQKTTVIFLILFLFAAIRYGVGFDYVSYKGAILGEGGDSDIERWELFPRLIGSLARQTHFQVFFIILSFLTLFPIYRVVSKLSIDPVVSILIYALHPMLYIDCLSIVRNAVAYSFVFLSFYYLYIKKVPWAIVAWIVACLFHKSAVIGILVFFLFKVKIGRKWNILLFAISFFLSIIIPPAVSFLAERISAFSFIKFYIDNQISSAGGKLQYVNDLINLLNLLLWNRLISVNKDNRFYITSFNAGTCLWNIFVNLEGTLAIRFGSYFLFFILLIAPSYALLFNRKYVKLARQNVIAFFLVLLSLSFVTNTRVERGTHISFLPYQTIFHYETYYNY